MLFLKKFKANGFKSFADNIEINFEKPLTGIVGPNGAGKSNVVDALKWVLGERSLKQLRGKSSEDIIFFGSKDKKPHMFAEVTLVFDNSRKVLHTDLKEVAVTRRVHRGSGISDYFLNDKPSTLKDINDIFLDTGLAKGSLGIISQGTVSWFVEAKSEDRRTIFEEAAGIGRYSKKKEESLRNLERVEKNFDEVSTIVNVLSRDLSKLEKQASKARIYVEKKEQLKNIELTLLVQEYLQSSEQIKDINSKIKFSGKDLLEYEPEIVELNEKLNNAKLRFSTADKNISEIQMQLQEHYENNSQLEQRKMLMDQQLQTEMNAKDKSKLLSAIVQNIKSVNFKLSDCYRNIKKQKQALEENLKVEKNILETVEKYAGEISECDSRIIYLKQHISFLIDYENSDLDKAKGAREILKNIDALTGIHGMVQDFIEVDKKYKLAIQTALGKNLKNLIVNTSADADRAINFLKENDAGRATFLPIEEIKYNSIKPEHMEVLKQLPEFIGVAKDLIKYNQQYDPIFNSLLGNIIIANDLESAIKLSRFVYQMYRVISLDGQIVYAGGAITGGSVNKSNVTLGLKDEIKSYKDERNDAIKKISALRAEYDKYKNELEEHRFKVNELRVTLNKYEEQVNMLAPELEKLKIKYESISGKSFVDNKNVVWNQESIQKSILELQQNKDKLLENLKINQQAKLMYSSQIDDYEKRIIELRNKLDTEKNALVENKEVLVRLENVQENAKRKINELYKMTVENAIKNFNKELKHSEKQARTIIDKLRAEIDSLGVINLEALEEVDDKKSQYNDLIMKRADLQTARDEILQAINELDNKARQDFKNLIDNLNKILPETFVYLFGGGTCQVRYSDPNEDVLTTGIDVFANPPGKNVSNLNLLSGGEKTLVALSVLFSILKISAFPLVILDEAESALDPANVERFANIIRASTDNTQFIVITHRQGTMTRCDKLLGATMQTKGVTKMLSVDLDQASKYGSEQESEQIK